MPVAPPRPRNLPLNALRAFEASARLGSFVLAAQELGVTPGAVAAHIKSLEAEIGAPLFERQTRAIAMTPLARRVLPEFVAAFDALSEATQSLRAEAAPLRVHVAALPAIAQLWLSPRLPALRKAAPDIAVSITAMEAPPNLKRVPFDVSIFYRPRSEGTPLDEDVIFPVCAPALAGTLRHPHDLQHAICLTDVVWAADWSVWMKKATPGFDLAPRGPVFSISTAPVCSWATKPSSAANSRMAASLPRSRRVSRCLAISQRASPRARERAAQPSG
jgi:LysR family glycine cleavage system transcriptional activator